jgi:hypothetical protein
MSFGVGSEAHVRIGVGVCGVLDDRYPAWLPAGAAEQQQMVDTNPLAMSLLPPSHPCQSSTIAVYNPIYGQDNVSYAVTIPPKLLLTKVDQPPITVFVPQLHAPC